MRRESWVWSFQGKVVPVRDGGVDSDGAGRDWVSKKMNRRTRATRKTSNHEKLREWTRLGFLFRLVTAAGSLGLEVDDLAVTLSFHFVGVLVREDVLGATDDFAKSVDLSVAFVSVGAPRGFSERDDAAVGQHENEFLFGRHGIAFQQREMKHQRDSRSSKRVTRRLRTTRGWRSGRSMPAPDPFHVRHQCGPGRLRAI